MVLNKLCCHQRSTYGLHMTSLTIIVDEICTCERLSCLAESFLQLLHACTFPLFIIKHGGRWHIVQILYLTYELARDISFFVLYILPDTQGLQATSRCGLQFVFFQGPLPPTHHKGLKQGYPFYSPYKCRLGYHQSEAWLVESTASQLYVASVPTGIRTHILLINTRAWIRCS